MSRFFIDRPVFAIVISLFLLLVGTLSLIGLPIGEFPNIALPTVQVNGFYLGASSDVVEESVSAPMDQQINGATDMLYISSVSGDDGSASISVTFELERDPDLAAVEVQNRVAQANSQLPSEVINAGVTVRKQSPDTLLYFAIFSPDGTYDPLFISNYGYVYVVDELKRVKGVGDVKVFGSDFGMRIWLAARPHGLARHHGERRGSGDSRAERPGAGGTGRPAARDAGPELPVLAAREGPAGQGRGIREHHRRLEAGRVVHPHQGHRAGRTRRAQLQQRLDARRQAGGARVRVAGARRERPRDGRAAEGADHAPGGEFPKGLDYKIVYDTSEFVEASVEEVIHTFVEALILVLIVVFLFLQNWRTTVIPMLAVPVSLVATFAAFQVLGFTINTLSLFGMVLAIGIVVDDAIVVVEAVEHKMRTGLAVREATIEAMEEVQGPVIAIALILAAVFVPMGFIPGVTGQLYKQFAVTVAVSTMFSAVVAITLTPTLCILLMKPHEESNGLVARFFRAFNSGFDRVNARYGAAAAVLARRTLLVMLTLGIVIFVTVGLFRAVPTGFVPDEDKGAVFMQVLLPDAASQERTDAILAQVEPLARAIPGVDSVVGVSGYRPALRHGGIERRAGHREAQALGRAHHGRDRACGRS